ncbi:hypothetical protein MauCBS54593_004528 [Microsporum audouinii]
MSEAIKLPGFGIPLNESKHWRASPGDGFITNTRVGGSQKFRTLFGSALDGADIYNGCVFSRLTPLREITMIQVMNNITDKPDWDMKVFDTSITDRWRKELLEDDGLDVTEKMVDWIIAELQHKSKMLKETGLITAFDSGVIKSDSVIPAYLRESLRAAVARLEDVPETQKDYHPHSDNQVLDLVHPSLFPLVYGRTRIIKDGILDIEDGIAKSGTGEVIPIPADQEIKLQDYIGGHHLGEKMNHPFSQRFQWLPCDIAFGSADDSKGEAAQRTPSQCTITSYINNLHPKEHKELYGILEQVISRAIPLWNATLSSLLYASREYKRIEYTSCVYDPDPNNIPEKDRPQQLPDEDEGSYDERICNWEREVRKVALPEPGDFTPRKQPDPYDESKKPLDWREMVDLQGDYEKTGLQVIVKLANIHLTPEKPRYDGGSWHVEGQLNEHICATALYYYDSVNITESRLEFRHLASFYDADEVKYEQDDHAWLKEVFGCEQYGSTVQEIGSVLCKEGRLVTFPNKLQHRVRPFELEDPTKPGHRKILALFLVDPNLRIISTANVPVQRADWLGRSVPRDGALGNLPRELFDEVVSYLGDNAISMEEAKELRLELMEERKAIVAEVDNSFSEVTFSLCEH